MLGYWAMGRVANATPPISTMTIASTLARTGRLMKNSEIIDLVLTRLFRRYADAGWPRGNRACLRHHLLVRDRAAIGAQHDPVIGVEARGDFPQPPRQQ